MKIDLIYIHMYIAFVLCLLVGAYFLLEVLYFFVLMLERERERGGGGGGGGVL